MLRAFVAGVFGAVAMVAGAHAQVVFQGDALVRAATPAYTSNNIAAGSFYRMVYRPSFGVGSSNPPPEGMALYSERATSLVISNDPSGLLVGQVNTRQTLITSRAVEIANDPGTSDLKVATFSGSPVSSSNNLVMTGTIDNFYDTTGCTVSIHAAMGIRP